MQTKVEGLVISKVPYKDKDLIVKLLLRNGKKISAIFRSGRGGGKKNISTIVELGFMLNVELVRKKSFGDLFLAKEWTSVWMHEKIRDNYSAFSLLCFFLEVFNRLAIEENLFDENRTDDDNMGNFKVISNALFYLEKSLNEKQFNRDQHLFFFLIKLFIEQGIFPDLDNCTLCDADLKLVAARNLVINHGGFACANCHSGQDDHLFNVLKNARDKKYDEYSKVVAPGFFSIVKMIDYFCSSFQLSKSEFKSLNAL